MVHTKSPCSTKLGHVTKNIQAHTDSGKTRTNQKTIRHRWIYSYLIRLAPDRHERITNTSITHFVCWVGDRTIFHDSRFAAAKILSQHNTQNTCIWYVHMWCLYRVQLVPFTRTRFATHNVRSNAQSVGILRDACISSTALLHWFIWHLHINTLPQTRTHMLLSQTPHHEQHRTQLAQDCIRK